MIIPDLASLLLKHADYLPTALRTIRELKKDCVNKYVPADFSFGNPFETDMEKRDITGRADWLIEKVLVAPHELIDSMPHVIGRQYQGQWAMYACVMTTVALCNIIRIYPELENKYLCKVPFFIELIMTDEVKYYDTMQWKEDALLTLNGNKSHMTYLSLLAWTISCYRLAGGDNRYDSLLQSLCKTLARRMGKSRDLNLPSFPNGIVFLPDMMVILIALKNYGILNNREYDSLVRSWIDYAKRLWIDSKTGLIISQYYPNGRKSALHGSYSALNCTYLTMIDAGFAAQQYEKFKRHFLKYGRYPIIKEYLHKSPSLGFHIDAGPIIEGVSPTGIAFALGVATYFEDWNVRAGLLKTAELAGKTIEKGNNRHYKLADIMLTGEAITLAMRTNIKMNHNNKQS